MSRNKRIEVVKSMMASEVLKIKIGPKRGRPADFRRILSDDEKPKAWLLEFLDRQDICRQMPGRKDQVYVGKDETGERKYVEKRYLLWKIRDLLNHGLL